MQSIELIFSIVILIASIVVHELAHGYTADFLGDPTPRMQGRLTINPIPHLDLIGSIILPGLLVLTGAGFILGWAKPVVFNPMNFKDRRWGPALVAVAGPVSNIILAIIFAVIIRIIGGNALGASPMASIMASIVFINVLLAIFNLIPVPPLDGHHILFALLGHRARRLQEWMMQYSIILFFVIIFFAWQFIFPLVSWIFTILVGV